MLDCFLLCCCWGQNSSRSGRNLQKAASTAYCLALLCVFFIQVGLREGGVRVGEIYFVGISYFDWLLPTIYFSNGEHDPFAVCLKRSHRLYPENHENGLCGSIINTAILKFCFISLGLGGGPSTLSLVQPAISMLGRIAILVKFAVIEGGAAVNEI